MRARRARWSADSPPPRSRSPARHQIGNQTFSGCEPPAPGPRIPSQGQYRGLSAAPPRPPLPALPPGPLTAWPGLPGAAARPGRVVRALSLGRKRKRADGRGALARRLLCGDPRLRAPGVGAAGAGSARYPNPAPRRTRSGRTPGAAGAKVTSPRASTIVQAPGPQLAPPSPPSCPPAPGKERAAPRERPGCGAPRWARCGGSCVVAGEGTGNCPRGLEEPRRGDAGREAGAAAMGALRAASQRFTRPPPDPPPRDSAPH